MNCHGKATQTSKLQAYIDQGLTREEIIEAFVAEYGSQDILARPIDRGFNRLAWLFPYLAAMVALGGIGFTARRWSSRQTVSESPSAPSVDPALDARLDDELRDLD